MTKSSLNHPACRTFDVLDGKHPVRLLLTVLSNGEGMAEALWSWLDEVCPGAVAAPSKVKLAVSSPASKSLDYELFGVRPSQMKEIQKL